MNFTVCSALGAYETHKEDGKDYDAVSWDTIKAMAAEPPSVPKDRSRWVIPSAYHAFDARVHAAQRERGEFWLLCLDVDKGSPTLDQVADAVEAALGGVYEAILYASRSCTPEMGKWRVMIPLAAPVAGWAWKRVASHFYDRIEGCGVTPDRSLARPGQVIYLPNRGDFYDWMEFEGPRFDPHAAGWVPDEAQRDEVAVRDVPAPEPQDGVIGAFNAAHSIESLLQKYGYAYAGDRSSNWRSPMQESASFATRDFGTHWVSLSESDAEAGIGRQAADSDARFGDAFDLFVYFEHGGDWDKAIRAAGREASIGRVSRFAARMERVAPEVVAAMPLVIDYDNNPEAAAGIAAQVEQFLGERHAVFASGGLPSYIRSGAISFDNPVTGEKEIASQHVIEPVKDAMTWEVMRAPHVVFMKEGRGNQPPSPAVRMPEPVAQSLVKRGGDLLPPLEGVLQSPALSPDGRLLTSADGVGYDPETRLWVAVQPLHGEALTFANPAHALAWLEGEWLGEFAFETREDGLRALLMLGSLLTSKTMLGEDAGPPAFLFSAPQSSTGKTVLARSLIAAATGSGGPSFTFPKEEEEVRKSLFAKALGQPAAILFDNVERGRTVASPVCCQFITDVMFEQRVLKESATRSASARVVLALTGNGIAAGGDMVNRTVTVKMRWDGGASPSMRVFKRRDGIIPWTIANRATIIEAMRVILTGPVPTRGAFSRMPTWAKAVLFPICTAAGVEAEDLLSDWVTESAEDEIVEDVAPLLDVMHREGMTHSATLGCPPGVAGVPMGAPIFTVQELRDFCAEPLAALLGVTKADVKGATAVRITSLMRGYEGLMRDGMGMQIVRANLGQRTNRTARVCFRLWVKGAHNQKTG